MNDATAKEPSALTLAILGDEIVGYSKHASIKPALEAAASEEAITLDARWVPTSALTDGLESVLDCFDGVLAAPQSIEYCKDERALLGALTYVRQSGIPSLAVCGGAQYALRESAANLAPEVSTPVLREYRCSVDNITDCQGVYGLRSVHLAAGSRAARAYPRSTTEESFSCDWLPDKDVEAALAALGVVGSGSTPSLGTTVFEWSNHPFFIAALFLPQLSRDQPHPLFVGLLRAMANAPT